jgi:hypothetical protein
MQSLFTTFRVLRNPEKRNLGQFTAIVRCLNPNGIRAMSIKRRRKRGTHYDVWGLGFRVQEALKKTSNNLGQIARCQETIMESAPCP